MLDRAIVSVVKQAVRPDLYILKDKRKDHPYLSWYCAVADHVNTPYVAILHDDDWYEPTFIEQAEALLKQGAGYVFTDAKIHFPDDSERLNLSLSPDSSGFWDYQLVESKLFGMPYCISPSCCVFRTEDVLRSLIPGGVPCPFDSKVLAGPDALLTLLPLLWRDNVGVIGEPLSNFTAHAGSVTIDAMGDAAKNNDLLRCYLLAKRFYRACKDTYSG